MTIATCFSHEATLRFGLFVFLRGVVCDQRFFFLLLDFGENSKIHYLFSSRVKKYLSSLVRVKLRFEEEKKQQKKDP